MNVENRIYLWCDALLTAFSSSFSALNGLNYFAIQRRKVFRFSQKPGSVCTCVMTLCISDSLDYCRCWAGVRWQSVWPHLEAAVESRSHSAHQHTLLRHRNSDSHIFFWHKYIFFCKLSFHVCFLLFVAHISLGCNTWRKTSKSQSISAGVWGYGTTHMSFPQTLLFRLGTTVFPGPMLPSHTSL